MMNPALSPKFVAELQSRVRNSSQKGPLLPVEITSQLQRRGPQADPRQIALAVQTISNVGRYVIDSMSL